MFSQQNKKHKNNNNHHHNHHHDKDACLLKYARLYVDGAISWTTYVEKADMFRKVENKE